MKKLLTYNERDADQPEREKSTTTFCHKLEVSEEGVQLDWKVLHQEYDDGSQGHHDRSIDGEKHTHYRLLESKVWDVVTSAIPVHWDTTWMVVIFQFFIVEALVCIPILLSNFKYQY